MTTDDSDETEGRRLYRARADTLAKSQIAMGKRAVRYSDVQTPETKHERDCLYVTSDGPAPCTCKAGYALDFLFPTAGQK